MLHKYQVEIGEIEAILEIRPSCSYLKFKVFDYTCFLLHVCWAIEWNANVSVDLEKV